VCARVYDTFRQQFAQGHQTRESIRLREAIVMSLGTCIRLRAPHVFEETPTRQPGRSSVARVISPGESGATLMNLERQALLTSVIRAECAADPALSLSRQE